MIAIIGAQSWAQLATLQSVGVFASVIIAYGWNISGPRHAAGSPVEGLQTLITDSLKVRGLLLLAVAAAALSVSFWWSDRTPWISLLAFLSTAVIGLRVNWLFIGCNRAGYNLLVDTLPRSALIAAGLAGGALQRDVTWILLGPIAGVGLSILVGYVVTRRWANRKARLPGESFGQLLRNNAHELVASLSSGAFLAAPIVLVSLVAPEALAVFALIDRIWKQANTAFSPIFDYLHSTAGPRATGSRKTGVRTVSICGAISASGGVLFTIVSEPLTKWMGHGQIQIGLPLAAFFGILFTVNNTSLVMTEISLSVAGLLRRATPVLVFSTLLGLFACALLARLYGAEGAMLGLISGYSASLGYGYFLLSYPLNNVRRHRLDPARRFLFRPQLRPPKRNMIGRHDVLVRARQIEDTFR